MFVPVLQYLYVSRIRNEKYAYVPQVFPAFKGWTDTLIRERQKNEATDGSFGLGEIVAFVEDNEVNSGQSFLFQLKRQRAFILTYSMVA